MKACGFTSNLPVRSPRGSIFNSLISHVLLLFIFPLSLWRGMITTGLSFHLLLFFLAQKINFTFEIRLYPCIHSTFSNSCNILPRISMTFPSMWTSTNIWPYLVPESRCHGGRHKFWQLYPISLGSRWGDRCGRILQTCSHLGASANSELFSWRCSV